MPDLKAFDEASADLLRLVVETGHIGIWKLDLPTGKAWRNARHDEIFGYEAPLPDWTYEMFLDHVIEEDRARVDTLQRRAIANGEEWLFECRIRRTDGERRWISASGRPVAVDDGSLPMMIGHVIDITDTKRNEERLSMVTRELNHRVRNMLATIRAMINFTGRQSRDVATFASTLGGRVEALARTQDLLVGEVEETLSFADMLARELDAFDGLAGRVDFDPRVPLDLPPHLVQPVALVLHELVTNAIKYGAFSNDTGRVAITVDRDERGTRIEWVESGGPPVASPDRKGFGSQLIARALGSAGMVTHMFAPQGVRCTILLDA